MLDNGDNSDIKILGLPTAPFRIWYLKKLLHPHPETCLCKLSKRKEVPYMHLKHTCIQWSLYFNTIHGTMTMWLQPGSVKLKVQLYTKLHFGTKILIGGLLIKVVLK